MELNEALEHKVILKFNEKSPRNYGTLQIGFSINGVRNLIMVEPEPIFFEPGQNLTYIVDSPMDLKALTWSEIRFDKAGDEFPPTMRLDYFYAEQLFPPNLKRIFCGLNPPEVLLDANYHTLPKECPWMIGPWIM